MSESHNVEAYELDPGIAAKLKLNDAGLIPAIVQADDTGAVLMMAWMDTHALAYTLATKRGTYFSRSRNEYWIKGLTSGNTQQVTGARLDCDGDTVLLRVLQTGGACHTGNYTCFDDVNLMGDQ